MDIRPFKGWRYSTPRGDVSRLIAPPYDILSADDKAALLAAAENNIVGVDMPQVPPKEAGPDSVYAAAAQRLAQWQRQGVLKQDDQPCLYAYEQSFEWSGRSYTRRALIAGVRATPFGQDIIPHEHTFAGPKADRMKLTQHTRMQLSPIFGFYDDAGGKVTDVLFAGAGGPSIFGEMRGVKEKLWVISDAKVVAAVTAALGKTPVFIADGHHRYTTAMIYRDELLAAGKIDASHEANYVMFALVPKQDAGLLILPTHRMVRGLSADFTLDALAAATPEFQWQRFDVGAAYLSDADDFLAPFGEHAMAFIGPWAKDMRIARLADANAMQRLEPRKVGAWRNLDVAILQRLVMDNALAGLKADDFAVDYTADGQEVIEACRTGKCQMGVCLQSTPLSAVEAVAQAGEVMPHKSTYFYPKLATGMVLKPME